jgi:hypothetical protein
LNYNYKTRKKPANLDYKNTNFISVQHHLTPNLPFSKTAQRNAGVASG